MGLFIQQKQTYRYSKQTYGYQRGNMGGGRTNQKLGMNITIMYQRHNQQDLLYSTENSAQYLVITYMRKEYKKCICIMELLHCTSETSTKL